MTQLARSPMSTAAPLSMSRRTVIRIVRIWWRNWTCFRFGFAVLAISTAGCCGCFNLGDAGCAGFVKEFNDVREILIATEQRIRTCVSFESSGENRCIALLN